MLNKRLLLALSLMALIGLAVQPVLSNGIANPVTILPVYVFKANGAVYGTVINPFLGSGEVAIGVSVAGESSLVALNVRRIGGTTNVYFQANMSTVYYSMASCQGTIYVPVPTETFANPNSLLLNTAYGVGPDPGNGDAISILKGTGGASMPTTNSRYSSGACGDQTQSAQNLFTASVLATIPDGPYTLE